MVENAESIYVPDPRINSDRCDASQINFKKGSSYQFKFDLKAPYLVEFKNLVNTYGVSNNALGSDTLNMYIYSDYLRQSIRVPQFLVKDREIIIF